MSARELYIGLLLRGRGTMGTGEISNAVIPHAMLTVSVGFAYFVAQRYPHSHLHLPFAMCHVLFSICHSHSCILAGQWWWWHEAWGTFAFITLFGFCLALLFALVPLLPQLQPSSASQLNSSAIATASSSAFTFICLHFVHVIRSLALTFRGGIETKVESLMNPLANCDGRIKRSTHAAYTSCRTHTHAHSHTHTTCRQT